MKTFTTLSICLFIVVNCFSQSFTNPSVELWSSPTVCETNTPPDGWTDYSNVGLGPDEANFPLCSTTVPTHAADGIIYARCLAGNPNTGEGMYQFVSGFTTGKAYRIDYNYSGSNRFGGNGDCVWHLFIDDIDVNQSAVFSSGDTVWHVNTYVFMATATTHKIGVRAYTPTYNGGGSAGIDLFNVTSTEPTGIENNFIAENISVTPNPFQNNLLVNIPGKSNAKFILSDMIGQAVYSHDFSDVLSIDTEKLRSGIYFYRVLSNDKILREGKIVKE